MVRFQITLDLREMEALSKLAAKEVREPRDQVRIIVREELQRRGLLVPKPEPGSKPEADRGQ